jgi:hypothetical protein
MNMAGFNRGTILWAGDTRLEQLHRASWSEKVKNIQHISNHHIQLLVVEGNIFLKG